MGEKEEKLILGLTKSEFTMTAILIGVIALMITGIIIYMLWYRLSKREKEEKITRFLNITYRVLRGFPLTKGYTRKCYKRLRELAVTTEAGLRRETTMTALKGVLLFILVSVGGMFLVQDLVCRLLLIILGLMIAKQSLNRRVSKLSMRILNKLSGYIGLVREEFLRCESIIDALSNAEVPPELESSVEQIIDIMTSSDVEGELAKFIERTYCDYVKSFAIACVRINDMGEEIEENKEPTFIKVLSFLEEDVNAELERRFYVVNKFGWLEWTSLIPVLVTDLLPNVLAGSIPGLNAVYEGISGYMIKVLLVLSGVMGYYIITMLSQIENLATDDRSVFFEQLATKKEFAAFAEKASPKKKARRKLELLINKSLSKKSIRAITLERIGLGLIAFICTIVVGFAAGAAQKSYATKSTNTFGMIASSDTEKWDDEYIRNLDETIFEVMKVRSNGDATIKAEELMTDEEIHAMLSQGFSGLTELQLSDQVTRVKKKYDLINSAYFHWYFILIAFGVAVVAYMVPIWLLKFRLWNIHKQEQEEFLALQTLCTIIAISDSDVLDALEAMYKMAKLYRERLLRCYLNYCIDPKKELARLESKVELTDFKRLVKKMELAVDEVSLKDAFEGMEIERKHIVAIREQEARKQVDDRRNKAGMVSKVSMAILVVGMLIYPIIYVGFTELLKVFDSLQAL